QRTGAGRSRWAGRARRHGLAAACLDDGAPGEPDEPDDDEGAATRGVAGGADARARATAERRAAVAGDAADGRPRRAGARRERRPQRRRALRRGARSDRDRRLGATPPQRVSRRTRWRRIRLPAAVSRYSHGPRRYTFCLYSTEEPE